jgi:hypothetical protein
VKLLLRNLYANAKLGRKGFPGTNTLAYFAGTSMGPGKTTYTFSVMFRFPLPPPGRLACCQQAGKGWVRRRRNGKYIGISGKRICYFTPVNDEEKSFVTLVTV